MANQIIFYFIFFSFEIALVLGKVRANKTLCLRFGFSSTFSRVPELMIWEKKYKKNYLIYLFLMWKPHECDALLISLFPVYGACA